jgi:uncharacterized membrane protein
MKGTTWKFIAAIAAYIAILIPVILIAKEMPPGPAQTAVRLLPLIPGIFVVLIQIEMVGKQDEMFQRVQLEGFGLAFGGVFLITLTEALLPGEPFFAFPPAFRLLSLSVLWATGIIIARRKYQ